MTCSKLGKRQTWSFHIHQRQSFRVIEWSETSSVIECSAIFSLKSVWCKCFASHPLFLESFPSQPFITYDVNNEQLNSSRITVLWCNNVRPVLQNLSLNSFFHNVCPHFKSMNLSYEWTRQGLFAFFVENTKSRYVGGNALFLFLIGNFQYPEKKTKNQCWVIKLQLWFVCDGEKNREQFVQEMAELFYLSMWEKKRNSREERRQSFSSFSSNAPFWVSFIIYCPNVLSAIRIRRGNEHRQASLFLPAHTLVLMWCDGWSGTPCCPPPPPSCPTFWQWRNEISLLISCAAVSRKARAFTVLAVSVVCKASSTQQDTVYLPQYG